MGTVLSRRLCEVLGVAFFGLALLWVISLASYSAHDPVLFFSTAAGRPGNFGGRVGALLAELAFQVLGYGAYLLPAALVVVGWHYFWVRALTAPWTKLAGGVVLFSAGGAALAIAFGRLPIGGKAVPRRRRARRRRRRPAHRSAQSLGRAGAGADRPVPVAADGHAAVVRGDRRRDRRLRAACDRRPGQRDRRPGARSGGARSSART